MLKPADIVHRHARQLNVNIPCFTGKTCLSLLNFVVLICLDYSTNVNSKGPGWERGERGLRFFCEKKIIQQIMENN